MIRSHQTYLFCSLTILAATAILARAAVEPVPIEEFHSLSLDYHTPHTKWAKPYAGGKVRVLFFTPWANARPRMIVELMQRFDVEATAVYWTHSQIGGNAGWYGGKAGELRLAQLLDEDFDCYIFNGIPQDDHYTGWSKDGSVTPQRLSTELQYKLLKRVTEGAGLVMVGVDDSRVFKPDRALDALPSFLAEADAGKAFTIKQGRGVLLQAAPVLPYHFGWQKSYDHWQNRLGRAVLWAAGHEPQFELSTKIDPNQLQREQLPGGVVTFSWSGSEQPVQLTARLRRDDGAIYDLKVGSDQSSPATYRCAIPLIPAGRYHLEAWLRSANGVEAWNITPLEIRCESQFKINLTQDWGEVGGDIAGTVALRQGEERGAKGGERRVKGEGRKQSVRVQLSDRRGRELARQQIGVGGEPAPFHFPIEPWMPMLLQVEAVLLDDNVEAARVGTFFNVTGRHQDRFNLLMWRFARGPERVQAQAALAEMGVTSVLPIKGIGDDEDLIIPAHDIAWVPYDGIGQGSSLYQQWLASDPKEYVVPGRPRVLCFNHEPSVQLAIRELHAKWQSARQQGVLAYSLGDEIPTKDACLRPVCVAAYQRYLNDQYGQVDALNKSWGTNYTSFQEVEVRDERENTARSEKNDPRWYDRQAFRSYNYAVNHFGRLRDAYRKLDPAGLTGFEGAGHFGEDYDLIVRNTDFWAPYEGTGDEIIRSIAPKRFMYANWMGYKNHADPLLRRFWRMIIRGANLIPFYMWEHDGQSLGLLKPDLTPFSAVEEWLADTQVVWDGLGELLMRSDMADDGVAMLYSLPSSYACQLDRSKLYGHYQAAHVAWHRAIRDLGLQFRYVTDRMLRLGEFEEPRFKVLILPRAEAIGTPEAMVIKRFVHNGGTVIADLRPGVYDGHCKYLDRGLLDELFGIRRGSSAEPLISNALLGGDLANRSIDFAFKGAKCDPSVAVAGGDCLGRAGDVPLFIVNKVGKGQAVLLNFSMTEGSYPPINDTGSPERAAHVLDSLFLAAGVKPALVMQSQSTGNRLRNIEAVRWNNGEIEILALFRQNGQQEKAHVELPEARFVYDLKGGRFLGRVRGIDLTISPNRASLFALLPSAAGRVEMDVATSSRRGSPLSIRLSVPGAAGNHAVRLHAVLPDGKLANWFSPVAVLGAEAIELQLPIAYNDPSGQWTLTATDLYSRHPVSRHVLLE